MKSEAALENTDGASSRTSFTSKSSSSPTSVTTPTSAHPGIVTHDSLLATRAGIVPAVRTNAPLPMHSLTSFPAAPMMDPSSLPHDAASPWKSFSMDDDLDELVSQCSQLNAAEGITVIQGRLERLRISYWISTGDMESLSAFFEQNATRLTSFRTHPEHFSLLHLCIICGSEIFLDALLQVQGWDLSHMDASSNLTALQLANRLGRRDLSHILMRHASSAGVDLDPEEAHGRDSAPTASSADVSVCDALNHLKQAYRHFLTQSLLEAASSGQFQHVRRIYESAHSKKELLNCAHPENGHTILHYAAMKGDAEMVEWAISQGANVQQKDEQGKIPLQLCDDSVIQEILVRAMRSSTQKSSPSNIALARTSSPETNIRMEGYLLKWTNYASGYKRRYFVLEHGILSYYKSQKDYPASCRGSLDVQMLKVRLNATDRHRLDIISLGSSVRYHLRPEEPKDKHGNYRSNNDIIQKWFLAIIQCQLRSTEADDEGTKNMLDDEGLELNDHFTERLLEMRQKGVYQVLLSAYSLPSLMISYMESHGGAVDCHLLALFKSHVEMCGKGKHHLMQLIDEMEAKSVVWKWKLRQWALKKAELEESIKILSNANNQLERRYMVSKKASQNAAARPLSEEVNAPSPLVSREPIGLTEQNPHRSWSFRDGEDEDEFYDALPFEEDRKNAASETELNRSIAENDLITEPIATSLEMVDSVASLALVRSNYLQDSIRGYPMKFRTILPANAVDKSTFSIWSVLKKAIHMDLSRMPVPVHFNEPISMLQRMAEDMEYSDLLKKAALCNSSLKPDESADLEDESLWRLMYVAAFAMSNYSSTEDRTSKPFNPLLGETFEIVCDEVEDEDATSDIPPCAGFRYVSEQVSHHPAISACYCESPYFVYWSEVNVKPSIYWGKSMLIVPHGLSHVYLPSSKEHYVWKKVTTSVNNIVIGKLWLDHYGEMRVTQTNTGAYVELAFKPAGWRGKEAKRVEGSVVDSTGKVRYKMFGHWNTEMLVSKEDDDRRSIHSVSSARSGSSKSKVPVVTKSPSPMSAALSGYQGRQLTYYEPPSLKNKPSTILPSSFPFAIWRKRPRPAHSSNMYFFTSFTMRLNELTPTLLSYLPLTDSRRRPDQRAMEEGNIDDASNLKEQLENKQRATRKERERILESVLKNKTIIKPVDQVKELTETESSLSSSEEEERENGNGTVSSLQMPSVESASSGTRASSAADASPSPEVVFEQENMYILKARFSREGQYEPRWFQHGMEEESSESVWFYRGSYWQQRAQRQWTWIPDIFGE